MTRITFWPRGRLPRRRVCLAAQDAQTWMHPREDHHGDGPCGFCWPPAHHCPTKRRHQLERFPVVLEVRSVRIHVLGSLLEHLNVIRERLVHDLELNCRRPRAWLRRPESRR